MCNLTNAILAQDGDFMQFIGVGLLVLVVLVAIVFFLLFLKFFRLWLQAKLSRADVIVSALTEIHLGDLLAILQRKA